MNKIAMLAAIVMVFSSAQAQTPLDLAKAVEACSRHAKSWEEKDAAGHLITTHQFEPGWENCIQVRKEWERSGNLKMQKDNEDRAAVDAVIKALPK